MTLEENFIRDKLVFKEVFLFVSFTSQIPLKQVLVFKLTLEMILLLGLIQFNCLNQLYLDRGAATKCQGAFRTPPASIMSGVTNERRDMHKLPLII